MGTTSNNAGTQSCKQQSFYHPQTHRGKERKRVQNLAVESRSIGLLERRDYPMPKERPVQNNLRQGQDLSSSLPSNLLLGLLTGRALRKPEVSRVCQCSPCRWPWGRKQAGEEQREAKEQREYIRLRGCETSGGSTAHFIPSHSSHLCSSHLS